MDLFHWFYWFRSGLEWVLAMGARQTGLVSQVLYKPVVYWQQGFMRAEEITKLTKANNRMQAELEALSVKLALCEPATSLITEIKPKGIYQLVASPNRWLILAGTKNGLQAGDYVTDSAGIVIGRLAKPGLYVSPVVTFSSLDEKVAVKVPRIEAEGILVGDGVSAIMTSLAANSGLEINDRVVTAGTDGFYPPNLMVGSVSEVISKPADVTLTVKVSLGADISKMGKVY
jgi:hypothetical protein